MKKQGGSNLEMVISFLLFSGFVFAAILIVNPSSRASGPTDSSLTYTFNSLVKNTSIELLSYSAKINANKLEHPVLAINFPTNLVEIPSSYNVRVEDYNGTVIPSQRVGSVVYIENKAEFVIIYFSEDFRDLSVVSSRPSVNTSLYELTSSGMREVLSQRRLDTLRNLYYSDYIGLKNTLGISSGIDFSFSLEYLQGSLISANKSTPSNVNIYSKILNKETISFETDNSIKYGSLGVKVW